MVGFGWSADCAPLPSAAWMFAPACLNVGLFCSAICCNSSSVIVFCSEADVCAGLNIATTNRTQERQSTNRVVQHSGDSASTCTSIIGVVRLFMFVLHPWHLHVHWLIAFPLLSQLHDLVVLVLRQHAHECHHSR